VKHHFPFLSVFAKQTKITLPSLLLLYNKQKKYSFKIQKILVIIFLFTPQKIFLRVLFFT